MSPADAAYSMTAPSFQRQEPAIGRRALVGGLAAFTLHPAAAAASPDAGLIALCAAYAEAENLYRFTCDREAEIEEATIYPEEPQSLLVRNSDLLRLGSGTRRADGKWWHGAHIEEFRDRRFTTTIAGRNGAERVPDHGTQARADEIVAAWDNWRAAREACEEASGLRAAREEQERALDEKRALRMQIAAIAPTTLAGFKAKAEVVALTYGREDLDLDVAGGFERAMTAEDLALVLVRDLLRAA